MVVNEEVVECDYQPSETGGLIKEEGNTWAWQHTI